MCRFLLYQGPSIRLSSLVTEPEHSLIHQSVHSSEREEPLNGDGFGLAWYAPKLDPRPALFRSVTPAWNDANLNELARVVESPCVLAHVRAATQVRSVNQANCHPFTSGPYAFMHNGDVGGFHRLRRTLISELSDEAFAAIQGGTDSEHAFALLLEHLPKEGASADQMVAAMRSTIRRLLALVERMAPGEPSYLNFALSNGHSSVVTRFTTLEGYAGESLYLHRGRRYVCEEGVCRMIDADEQGGAVILSSERLSDDPGWEAVPTNHLVVIDGKGSARLEPVL
ncbi:MAG: class II glutamine amidotransferase [Planctomycetaceae bacterium]|nr:class II glutamine amidotransferase [Planctomycetaceae bacterium]